MSWSLVVHGGAGELRNEPLDEALERAAREELLAVLAQGAQALAAGCASLDAVEQAVVALEDSPLFNAGRGAVFNAAGEIELEAAIMDGRTLAAGAVAVLRGVRNPIALARRVLERTPHVYLAGQGALDFARSEGAPLAADGYFHTDARWRAFEAARARAATGGAAGGTVGAVARDRHGNVAAATSTGGMTLKLPGRVGDSSVIGAGTFASNDSCAVSCTGHGEYFLRGTVARDVAAAMEYGGRGLADAAAGVLEHRVTRLGGGGGLIAVDRSGTTVALCNCALMYRGVVTAERAARVAILAGETL